MSIQLKKQQHILLSLIVTVLALVIGVFAFWGNKADTVEVIDKPDFKKHAFASPISDSANESHWIEKTQNAWKAELVKTEKIDKNIHLLTDEKDKQGKLIRSQNKELVEVKTMVAELKQQVVRLQTERTSRQEVMLKNTGIQNGLLPRADDTNQAGMEVDAGFIQYSARLNRRTRPRIKNPDNYVFSNTFAKAVVLLGADVSAGVLSQSNPDIMMFQIIDDGIMPNKHRSHLKHCFFSASAVGDISSERGKLRTERLSCIHEDGTSIDTQVTGIVSDSKNGIRGRAVWRDEPMVKRAFWGSFWQSMGNIGQQVSTDNSISPLGNVSTINPAKIPLAVVSSGGAGSSKMYADYNIKRAEMYHPIIQLPPGTIVDVTFLKGFWLDGGTDDKAPESPIETPTTLANSSYEGRSPDTPEDKATNQFFYKNHSL